MKPKRFDLVHVDRSAVGRFCWVDLAATDAEKAKVFYGRLLGWSFRDQAAHGGSFTRLCLADQDVGSLYQLNRGHLARGVSSHWTPYIQVDDIEDAAQRAVLLGGQVLVRPFEVAGIARIALVLDSIGASVGLWESSEKSAGDYA